MRWKFMPFRMSNRGLRHKLMLAFSLMSIIPLLACFYLISIYMFPQSQNAINITGVIVLVVVIAALGFLVAKGLVDPICEMAIEAKLIANGQYDRKIDVARDDEIGNLGASINMMTQRIKSNLDELKSYGQRVREINVEVHKKVLSLSSLLQLGDMISSGSMQIDSLLDIAVEKTAAIFDTGFCILYLSKSPDSDLLTKASYNLDKEGLERLIIKRDGKGLLNGALQDRSIIVIDRGVKLSKEAEHFVVSHNLKNILALPIYSGRANLGLLIAGNRIDDFKFKSDEVDLVKIFAKQITIAIESDILSKKTDELEIKDELTGLYNKNYITQRLEDEIKRAIFYQRPCSLVVFNIDNFRAFREIQGEIAAEDIIKRIAKIVKENSIPVGKVARTGGDEFAMILPEKNKKEAVLIAEDIRIKIAGANLIKDGKAIMAVSGGVSENPIDGATTDELFKKAAESLRQAKSLGKNRIVG